MISWFIVYSFAYIHILCKYILQSNYICITSSAVFNVSRNNCLFAICYETWIWWLRRSAYYRHTSIRTLITKIRSCASCPHNANPDTRNCCLYFICIAIYIVVACTGQEASIILIGAVSKCITVSFQFPCANTTFGNCCWPWLLKL